MAGTAAPGGCSPCLSEEREWISTTVWIADSKTPNGIAEVPLTHVAVEAFRDQMSIAGDGPYLFPSDLGACGHHTTFKTTWAATLRRAGVAHFRIYDLRSTYATRLKPDEASDERQALEKLNRSANERGVLRQTG